MTKKIWGGARLFISTSPPQLQVQDSSIEQVCYTMTSHIAPWRTSAQGHLTPDENGDLKTDYSRWRLVNEEGRQTWRYLESDEENSAWLQTVAEKYHLGLPTVCFKVVSLLNAQFLTCLPPGLAYSARGQDTAPGSGEWFIFLLASAARCW